MLNGWTNRRCVEVCSRGLRGWFMLVLACLGANVSAVAAGDGNAQTILFFGDSLTAGYGLANPGAEAYPAQIQDRLARERLPWRVINAGLSGETTAGGLRRVDWILRQPVDIFVLALGANDGLRGISPAVTRTNLQQIIDRVRAKNPHVKLVIAGMQMPEGMGADFAREFQALFPRVAEENAATLIPFLLEGVGGHPELNQGDQIHPNPQGHARIAETVWKVIKPLLRS